MTFGQGLREAVARRTRGIPFFAHALARYRRRQYERRIEGFLRDKDGHAGRLPTGVVYEATMRCNLHCEFCYVGTLLNIEGEWREELPLETLRARFPDQDGLQVSLTGGEIFMRKDILDVMEVFRDKGYVCGYLTTNGTIISDERARCAGRSRGRRVSQAHQRVDRRAGRAARQRARREGHVRADGRGACGGCRPPPGASARRSASASTRRSPTRRSTRSTTMVDVADELGVDAIGLNHLMFSTPEEVAETVRIIGAKDASAISTFVTDGSRAGPRACPRAGGRARRAGAASAASASTCGRRSRPAILEPYYTPGIGARRAGVSIRFSTRACRSAARSTSARSSGSRSGDLTHAVARGGLDRRSLRLAAAKALVETWYLSGLPALLQGRAHDRAAQPIGTPPAEEPSP